MASGSHIEFEAGFLQVLAAPSRDGVNADPFHPSEHFTPFFSPGNYET